MFEDVVGNNGGRFIIAAAAVAVGLLLLAVVLWFMRNRASSPFIRGGKNRQPRLAVLDAAAVDTRRRLVLVRRDDVEHLIMIGGPTDIVIESRIVGAKPRADQPEALANAASPTRPQLSSQTAAASLAAPARPDALPAPPARIAQERRPESRADQRPDQKQDARPDPKPEVRPAARPAQPPVSSMGQALYGDDAIAPRPQPTVRAPAPTQPTPLQPSPAVSGPRTAPEDILEAARARVLPQIPAPSAVPAPPQPAASAARPSPVVGDIGKRDEARDFERLLDAQISGDLGRLAPEQPGRTPTIEPPRPAKRAEPTLEEEMNRMLSEMGNERKS